MRGDLKASASLRKKGLLDMGAALGRADKNDIEARGALGEGNMLTKKDFCGHRDAGLLPRRYGPSGLILGFTLLNLHKGEVITTPRNKINLAALRFVALRKDAVALAFKKLPCATLRGHAYGVGALWGGAATPNLHSD
jgi:hypothetical protein